MTDEEIEEHFHDYKNYPDPKIGFFRRLLMFFSYHFNRFLLGNTCAFDIALYDEIACREKYLRSIKK